jgi:hypothetical protein
VGSSRSFSPQNVEFNAFLFASVGDEKNGMALTVMSALARLGFDPWNEAGRLAGLSRAGAAKALARMIAKLPVGDWQASDLADIASRLARLLPTIDVAAAAKAPKAVQPSPGRQASKRAAILVVSLMLLLSALFGMTRTAPPPPEIPSSASSGLAPPLR